MGITIPGNQGALAELYDAVNSAEELNGRAYLKTSKNVLMYMVETLQLRIDKHELRKEKGNSITKLVAELEQKVRFLTPLEEKNKRLEEENAALKQSLYKYPGEQPQYVSPQEQYEQEKLKRWKENGCKITDNSEYDTRSISSEDAAYWNDLLG